MHSSNTKAVLRRCNVVIGLIEDGAGVDEQLVHIDSLNGVVTIEKSLVDELARVASSSM